MLLVGVITTIAVLGSAPALLAEVLLDGIIAGAVYRRIREVPSQHWTTGDFRQPWKPMLAIRMALLGAAGIAQWLVPSSGSIGGFFRRGP